MAKEKFEYVVRLYAEYGDGPRVHVLGIFDTEEEARAKKQELVDNWSSDDDEVVIWWGNAEISLFKRVEGRHFPQLVKSNIDAQ